MNGISEKNNVIIEALLEKVKEKYPDSVDLFGVYGSVALNTCDEFSNVDICIIMRDGAEEIIETSFIFSHEGVDIGFAIRSMTWQEFSSLAGTVKQGVILQLKPLYNRDYNAIERFLRIKREAESSLLLPLDERKVLSVEPLIVSLKVANSDAQTALKEQTKYYVIKLLMLACEILTALNSSYFRFGLTERKKDVEMLSILPQKFLDSFNFVLEKNDEKDLKACANEITKSVCEIYNKLKKVYHSEELKPFCGSYEKFIAKVNSKFIKSQMSVERKTSSLVGYCVVDALNELYAETGVKFKFNYQDAFNSSKLPMLLKQIKDFFQKEYESKDIKLKKFTDKRQLLDGLFD